MEIRSQGKLVKGQSLNRWIILVISLGGRTALTEQPSDSDVIDHADLRWFLEWFCALLTGVTQCNNVVKKNHNKKKLNFPSDLINTDTLKYRLFLDMYTNTVFFSTLKYNAHNYLNYVVSSWYTSKYHSITIWPIMLLV